LCIYFLSLFSTFNAHADGWDKDTQASNIDSIINTRHNLTQSFSSFSSIMNLARNNYVEVCVYCHTPHGANRKINAPLWNRTINTDSYVVYEKPRTLNRPIGQPGPSSLTCLSCHDGIIAIDSIVNMPGSGGFNPAQESIVNQDFLNTWGGPGPTGTHFALGPETTSNKCTFCHGPNGGITGSTPEYTVFAIGTDLNDDHPIGVLYPEQFGPNADFNQSTIDDQGRLAIFDLSSNNRADKNEVRLYNSGEGFEVECASCHDPHGVPSSGPYSEFIASFLRVGNGDANTELGSPSGLCLTCHIK